MDTVARHTFTEESQPQATSELSYHQLYQPSQQKIMLRFILNRLKAKAEELLTEEPAGFRPSQSTVEQIMRQNNKMRGDRVTLPALPSLRPSHFTGQPISSVIYKETGW